MATESRTVTVNGAKIGLLPSDQVFGVIEVDPERGGDEWVGLLANISLINPDGTIAFYYVDEENVWHPAATYPPGWLGSYGPALRSAFEEDAEETSEAQEAPSAAMTVEVGGGGSGAASTPRQEIIDEVLETLARGEFPADDVGVTPAVKRLKDIWEGQGDPDDDPQAEDWIWTPGASLADIAEWNKRKQARDQAEIDRLRQESDKEAAWNSSPPDRDPVVEAPKVAEGNSTDAVSYLDRLQAHAARHTEETVEGWHGKATGTGITPW